jgi:DNA processing protein
MAAESLPGCLGDLSHPPAGLWLLGSPAALGGAPARHVAIVGTREATPYGIRVAERLATACARAGLVVVSGMARGVDAAAHRAALAAGGETIGVQGTGVDVPYPVGHRALLDAMARAGTIVSEMEPGTPAGPGCFPRRNRIIAALAKVTVVVEAGFKSGAMNTATQALDLGRVVAAVPGRIGDPGSGGANLLIRDGAHVVTDEADLLGLFGLTNRPGSATAEEGQGGPNALQDWRDSDWDRRGGCTPLRQYAVERLLADLGE